MLYLLENYKGFDIINDECGGFNRCVIRANGLDFYRTGYNELFEDAPLEDAECWIDSWCLRKEKGVDINTINTRKYPNVTGYNTKGEIVSVYEADYLKIVGGLSYTEAIHVAEAIGTRPTRLADRYDYRTAPVWWVFSPHRIKGFSIRTERPDYWE